MGGGGGGGGGGGPPLGMSQPLSDTLSHSASQRERLPTGGRALAGKRSHGD